MTTLATARHIKRSMMTSTPRSEYIGALASHGVSNVLDGLRESVEPVSNAPRDSDVNVESQRCDRDESQSAPPIEDGVPDECLISIIKASDEVVGRGVVLPFVSKAGG
jgi:hypothetical protein